ncbi:MAG TPA: DUF4189 domain-containing protein [Steroidobacteraceae bacterium]
MKQPVLTILVLGLVCAACTFRAAPVLAQEEQEQEQQEQDPPYQPAQENQVDPLEQQQQQRESACIITGACTCSLGMCTMTATGARFPAPAAPAFAGTWYASIAKSAGSAAWGASWHFASQNEADQAALANCNKGGVTDCKVEIGDVNNCLSLAESPDGAWGVGKSGLDRSDAIHLATEYCKKYGGKSCIAKVSVCGRQPTDSKPCLKVGPGIDISHWSAAALASLSPREREAFEHPAQHTNGACQ